MLSYSNYRDAGFTEAQAQLLVERDQIVRDQFTYLGEQISRSFADLQITLQAGFDAINRRFEEMNHRFEDIGHRFEKMNHRFAEIDHRFEEINGRLDATDRRLGARPKTSWTQQKCDRAPRHIRLKEVQPTATCGQTRLVGRTSRRYRGAPAPGSAELMAK